MQQFRQRKGIFAKEMRATPPNNYPYTGYLVEMTNKKSLNIVSVKDLKDEYRGKDKFSKNRLQYIRDRAKLVIVAGTGVTAEFLVNCFVMPGTKEPIKPGAPDSYARQSMIGLYGLHQYEAISKITTTKTGDKAVKSSITKGYCSYCSHYSGNHLTMNNHIWMHARLGLICHLDNCFTIEVKNDNMKRHGEVIHGVTWDPPRVPPSKMELGSD